MFSDMSKPKTLFSTRFYSGSYILVYFNLSKITISGGVYNKTSVRSTTDPS